MTVVCAIVSGDRAWMGSDSAVNDGDIINTTVSRKVGKFGELLLGYAGNISAGQWFFNRARRNPGESVAEMFDAAPRSLVNNADRFSLLAVEGLRIYEFNGDGGMMKKPCVGGLSYGAIGAGAQVAHGSLFAWHDERAALLLALQASAYHAVGVRRPFKIISL